MAYTTTCPAGDGVSTASDSGTGRDAGDPSLADRMPGDLSFSIRPGVILLSLAAVLGILTVLAIGFPLFASWSGRDVATASLRILDFRQEANIPTLFSTGLLVLAAVLLFIIGRSTRSVDRRMAFRWDALALIFAFLAVDETAMIHEFFNRFHVHVTGALAFVDRFPWMWFYGPVTALIGLFYLPFLGRLPRMTAAGMILSGAIYVAGAIGFEAFGAYQIEVEAVSRRSLAYILRGVAEEFCEMTGALLFIAVLLDHLARIGKRVVIGFGRSDRFDGA